MSQFAISMLKCQIMRLHKRSNSYVLSAMSEPNERIQFFQWRMAYACFHRAEELQDLLP